MSAAATHRRALAIVLALVVTFAAVEAVTAFTSGSLALLADAGHMATDALGIGLALAAAIAGARGASSSQRTFGHYRLEVLAALANAVLLLGVAVYVGVEAISRLTGTPEVSPLPMAIVGAGGLVVSGISYRLLHAGSRESINVRGAALEVLGDAIGSAGVIIAAIITLTTAWPYADPIVALGIGAFIVPRATRLGLDAVRILTQSAPRDVDVDAIARELDDLVGVSDAHDLHVWTLTSGMNVATVHVVRTERGDVTVLDRARRVLEQHDVDHSTIQVEDPGRKGCDQAHW